MDPITLMLKLNEVQHNLRRNRDCRIVIPGEVPSTDFPAVRGGQERREEDQLHLAACARGARLHLRHSEGLRNIILLGSLG